MELDDEGRDDYNFVLKFDLGYFNDKYDNELGVNSHCYGKPC